MPPTIRSISLDRNAKENKYVELLDVVEDVGLQEVRYGFDGARHLNSGVDGSNPYFVYDPAKCIVCSRCVRACEEVQGTFALTISGRGFNSIVSAGHERAVPQIGMRVLRRMRAGLPDRIADREERARRPSGQEARRSFGGDDLRLLRRRLLVQSRDAEAKKSCAWSRTRTARRTTAIPA